VTEVLKNQAVKYEDWDNSGTQNGSEPAVSLSDLEYRYNEAGQRIVKIAKPHHATLTELKDQRYWKYTYYSYDAGGNVVAVYERSYSAPSATYHDILKLEEHHVYSASRVGMVTYEDKEVANATYTYSTTVNHEYVGTFSSAASYSLNVSNEKRTLGTRLYELSNHLGNIVVTVSDKKIPVFENVTTCASTVTYNNTFTHYTADVQSTTDYSAFGAPLAERTFNSTLARYGMNGQEKDNEIYGDGNAMSAEYWMYDARLGRRWNVDPVFRFYESPYAVFHNNPIFFSDSRGLEPQEKTGEPQEGDTKSYTDDNGNTATLVYTGGEWAIRLDEVKTEEVINSQKYDNSTSNSKFEYRNNIWDHANTWLYWDWWKY
jgi:hypothetical protein